MCCPLPGHSTDEFADRYYVGNYDLWEGRIEYLIWGALLRISLDGPPPSGFGGNRVLIPQLPRSPVE